MNWLFFGKKKYVEAEYNPNAFAFELMRNAIEDQKIELGRLRKENNELREENRVLLSKAASQPDSFPGSTTVTLPTGESKKIINLSDLRKELERRSFEAMKESQKEKKNA